MTQVTSMFSGCITALVTPFKGAGSGGVDYKKLQELIEFQIQHQADGIVLVGTTGESPTLNDEEKIRIFQQAVKQTRGRIPLIAGTGTNDTRKTIRLTKLARACKMDAALIVVPYYNKPTQEGLYLHYRAVAKKVNIPIIIYNVPGRTVRSIDPETIARLARFKNIVAVKHASPELSQVSRIKRLCGLTVLSGEDALTLKILGLGGRGVISVVSNLVPQDVSLMVKAFETNHLALARKYDAKLRPLNQAIFIETNPIPVKTALALLGRLNGEMRLPLCAMSPANKKKLRRALVNYGLL